MSATGGSLVLVATPIGNLGDLSARAKEVLGTADVVCCEDTRRTRELLGAFGLPTNPRRLRSLYGHNEAARVGEVLSLLASGRVVALVSDAGTPAISDPGARVVAAVIAAGFPVTTVPGASAVLAALVVSGLATDRFCVEGFLPRRGAERRHRLETLATEERTAIVLEAPGRLAGLLSDLFEVCGDRRVAVCRELTKVHEEVWRGRLGPAAEAFGERSVRGEVVVVLEGRPPSLPGEGELADAIRSRLEAGDTPRQAADAVAAALGVPRRAAYTEALAQRDAGAATRGPRRPSGAPPGPL